MSERDVARKACNAAYARRLCGLVPRDDDLTYCGDFDVQGVVNATPIPRPDNHNHDWHWREMWKVFEQEWKAFEGAA